MATNAIHREIDRNSVIIITGRSCTGKSYLINNYAEHGYLIDNRRSAMETGNGDITPEQFCGAINSELPFICLDEAQLYQHSQIIELAQHALTSSRKILIITQYEENLPVNELIALVMADRKSSLCHIELEHWNHDTKQSSFSVQIRVPPVTQGLE